MGVSIAVRDALRRGRAAYAARHRALGLCVFCPLPVAHAGRCQYHYASHMERKRQAAARRREVAVE